MNFSSLRAQAAFVAVSTLASMGLTAPAFAEEKAPQKVELAQNFKPATTGTAMAANVVNSTVAPVVGSTLPNRVQPHTGTVQIFEMANKNLITSALRSMKESMREYTPKRLVGAMRRSKLFTEDHVGQIIDANPDPEKPEFSKIASSFALLTDSEHREDVEIFARNFSQQTGENVAITVGPKGEKPELIMFCEGAVRVFDSTKPSYLLDVRHQMDIFSEALHEVDVTSSAKLNAPKISQ